MGPLPIRCVLLAPLLFLAAAAQADRAEAQVAPAPPRAAAAPFQAQIDAYLNEDRANPPPKGAILFIGSSIFRNWKNLKRQMAPLPVFNRAFGGSRTWEVLDRMDQVVLPYEPRIIVYYCGSNDVNAGEKAEPIFSRFREFVERVHDHLPATRVFYVSINRAPQKRDRWDIVDAANAQVREYCATDPKLQFIDVNPVLFDAEGNPRLELYLPDQLHLRAPAYEEFTRVVKPAVAEAWGALLARAEESFRRWEKAIAAFEERDRESPPPRHAVLFAGSSSIVRWDLKHAFPEIATINRGFGGTQIADSTHFADRIIVPAQPRTIVFYAGDYDLAGGRSPAQVRDDFRSFVATVRQALPETKIIFIGIKPSPARWSLVEQQKEANRLIEADCQADPRLVFIDTFPAMLGDDDRPRPGLFQPDNLHLNARGYALWNSLLKPALK
jgi:lysophospholipase L1-like esterase